MLRQKQYHIRAYINKISPQLKTFVRSYVHNHKTIKEIVGGIDM